MWLEFVEVGLEDGEGFMEVWIGFVNVFDVTAWWDLIVDVTAKAVGENDARVLQGSGEEAGGRTSKRTTLGEFMRARALADDS